ncbi:uncharacterized protein LOC105420300 [Amborella trichopoda]|uniref:uncharacterized protein LOC105420300 n=1 Tax=Amborella trichopoda TaxID=13333 RepID=UPI0005D38A8D|nr:uncharacterized protein LOC105420300 [Amborella trichopoda]|eukprot:XP_011621756.1 uncharacterized protein LOC105420300 [Amborella trichopoda]
MLLEKVQFSVPKHPAQMHNKMTLEDPMSKVTLHPFQLSDIDDFMVWATDDRVRFFLEVRLATYWPHNITSVFSAIPELERVEALVDVESQRVLEKVGFDRYGVLRKYLILKGKTRDMFIYKGAQ